MYTSYANYGLVKKESLDPAKGDNVLAWLAETLKYGNLDDEVNRLPSKIEGGIQLIRCIKDGVILCKLLNVVERDLVEGIHEKTSTPFLHIDNINRYLKVCHEKFGISKSDNFTVADLYSDLNPRRVVDGLFTLSQNLHKAKDYRGPTLRK